MKRILLLTAGFGEGHNSAARGLRAGLARVSNGEAQVELHDLFSDTYGRPNDWACKLYLALINRSPRTWGRVYRWLDRQESFTGNFKIFWSVKKQFHALLDRFQPEVIASVYPAYPHMLDEMLGPASARPPTRVVVITDSLSVNAIWYRGTAHYYLLPNPESAAVLHQEGISAAQTCTFGFPVSPEFSDAAEFRPLPDDAHGRRVLYLVSSADATAPALVQRLAFLPEIQLTVAMGRNPHLRQEIEQIRRLLPRPFATVGWSEELPRLLRASHILISKAGGATVQEAIAAACPMIANRVIPGQEEGNARYIVQQNCGTVATSNDAVVAAVRHAFAHDGAQWHEWSRNITRISRPAAALDAARFLLSLG
ncbi:diglucosyl diacylglycerol synthase [soil metagenome]